MEEGRGMEDVIEKKKTEKWTKTRKEDKKMKGERTKKSKGGRK